MRTRCLFSPASGAGSLLVAAALSPCIAVAQKAPPGAAPREEQAAFQAVCGSCHPTSMIADFRSGADWSETIGQMISYGAQATDEQFKLVWRYLLRTLTRVNVNSAAASELAPVLDISEAAAEALVKRRNDKGNFKSLEELKKVPGVDAAKLEARKDRVVF